MHDDFDDTDLRGSGGSDGCFGFILCALIVVGFIVFCCWDFNNNQSKSDTQRDHKGPYSWHYTVTDRREELEHTENNTIYPRRYFLKVVDHLDENYKPVGEFEFETSSTIYFKYEPGSLIAKQSTQR